VLSGVVVASRRVFETSAKEWRARYGASRSRIGVGARFNITDALVRRRGYSTVVVSISTIHLRQQREPLPGQQRPVCCERVLWTVGGDDASLSAHDRAFTPTRRAYVSAACDPDGRSWSTSHRTRRMNNCCGAHRPYTSARRGSRPPARTLGTSSEPWECGVYAFIPGCRSGCRPSSSIAVLPVRRRACGLRLARDAFARMHLSA
jgi:hypothetical protein